jgi:transcriptional regulator with XRE-family HTH domain
VALAKKLWRMNADQQDYLSAIERSERNVSIDNIARIGKGLRVDPWKLLKDD